MENLAGDLLLGLKFVKLPILPTLFIHFGQGRLGELRSGYLGLKGQALYTGFDVVFMVIYLVRICVG